MKLLVKNCIEKLGLVLLRTHHFRNLKLDSDRYSDMVSAGGDLGFLMTLQQEMAKAILPWLHKSKSQIRQDLFVLSALTFKKNGYFVEFGATDGVSLSNTYLLEKEFGWQGILAEPARCWHQDLMKNRNCQIVTDCVWTESGKELTFHETQNPELSTLGFLADLESHAGLRQHFMPYVVPTISLNDMLHSRNAPRLIDYLSIDTEGSEYEILQALDFSRYRFRVITCEHNFTDARLKIFDLLSSNGYRRVLENLSEFDDWYVLRDVL